MTKAFADDASRRFGTRAVHAGQVADPLAGAVMTPIYQTSTYVQEGLGRNKGYEYARTSNPTREALERNIAALEGGRYGFAFGSGLAALDAVLKLLSAGDHVGCGENVYGGTHPPMTHIWAPLRLSFSFVDTPHPQRIAGAVTPATPLNFAPTPPQTPLRARPTHRAVAGAAPARGAHLLPRPALPPAAYARLPADERVRRYGESRARHRRAGAPLRRAHQDLRARGIARGRREPGGSSRLD